MYNRFFGLYGSTALELREEEGAWVLLWLILFSFFKTSIFCSRACAIVCWMHGMPYKTKFFLFCLCSLQLFCMPLYYCTMHWKVFIGEVCKLDCWRIRCIRRMIDSLTSQKFVSLELDRVKFLWTFKWPHSSIQMQHIRCSLAFRLYANKPKNENSNTNRENIDRL